MRGGEKSVVFPPPVAAQCFSHCTLAELQQLQPVWRGGRKQNRSRYKEAGELWKTRQSQPGLQRGGTSAAPEFPALASARREEGGR